MTRSSPEVGGSEGHMTAVWILEIVAERRRDNF